MWGLLRVDGGSGKSWRSTTDDCAQLLDGRNRKGLPAQDLSHLHSRLLDDSWQETKRPAPRCGGQGLTSSQRAVSMGLMYQSAAARQEFFKITLSWQREANLWEAGVVLVPQRDYFGVTTGNCELQFAAFLTFLRLPIFYVPSQRAPENRRSPSPSDRADFEVGRSALQGARPLSQCQFRPRDRGARRNMATIGRSFVPRLSRVAQEAQVLIGPLAGKTPRRTELGIPTQACARQDRQVGTPALSENRQVAARANYGKIEGVPGETWMAIDMALRKGKRGLERGSSLAKFLMHRFGVRNLAELPKFTVKQILLWAEAHMARTGRRPVAKSGPIAEAPGETWRAIDKALFKGSRGLRGKQSLAQLLDRHRPGTQFRRTSRKK